MRLRVGLTGGVASGKSTVSEQLSQLGAVVVDADLLAREVVAPGTDGLAEVVAAFGTDILHESGELDRQALGALVFVDEEKRRVLESIIHPRVRAASAALEAAAPPDAIVVHDIPLLVETGQAASFDVVLVVDAPRDEQVRRMVQHRNMSREDALARMAAQATREERLAVADVVIDNSGDLEHLATQVAATYEALRARVEAG